MFDEDARGADFRDDPVVFTREATTIVIHDFEGAVIQIISLPELHLRKSEVSPAWLASVEAERNSKE